MTEAVESPATSRRTLLCCAAAVLAGGSAVAVTGCSSDSDSSSSGTGGAASSSGGGAAGAVDLGAASEVPVGGGKVYRDQKIVVTQPTAGQYKAFSAKCTHAGCVVDQVTSGQISCPCHGSKFAVADGSVSAGPAPSSLPEYKVAVQDGKIQVTKA
ncbi:Rieske (2Fe-2S) protein [Kitasatospora terrestris]|uniref:Cytochrome bc1 complex Rieske iron-sulfur subunit n=1 Tax=Kitasatospora terrestris TaxID=258051 RepID=A0ABP9E736_9ACTN